MTPHPGQHWAEIMALREVTQVSVAGQIGCSVKHLNQIVRGNALPSVELTIAFAELMEMSPHLLWYLQADFVLESALG